MLYQVLLLQLRLDIIYIQISQMRYTRTEVGLHGVKDWNLCIELQRGSLKGEKSWGTTWLSGSLIAFANMSMSTKVGVPKLRKARLMSVYTERLPR